MPAPVPLLRCGALAVALLSCAFTSVAGASRGGAGASAAVIERGTGYHSPTGSQAVRRLQLRLVALGRDPGPIDGRYGRLTESAVVRFQGASNIAADGIVGPDTRRVLRRPMLHRGAGYGAPNGSALVRRLQLRLHARGYDPGPTDGLYGPRTEAAVRRFQWATGLAANGVAGPHTMDVLLARLHRAAGVRRPDDGRRDARRSVVHRAPSPAPTVETSGGWSSWGMLAFLAAVILGIVWLAVWLETQLKQLVLRLHPRLPRLTRRMPADVERALGYASATGAVGEGARSALEAQATAIERACRSRGWRLIEVVRDLDPDDSGRLERPALAYTLQLLTAGEATCLVVTGLGALARSSGDVAILMDRFADLGTRVVATDLGLDTHAADESTSRRVFRPAAGALRIRNS